MNIVVLRFLNSIGIAMETEVISQQCEHQAWMLSIPNSNQLGHDQVPDDAIEVSRFREEIYCFHLIFATRLYNYN